MSGRSAAIPTDFADTGEFTIVGSGGALAATSGRSGGVKWPVPSDIEPFGAAYNIDGWASSKRSVGVSGLSRRNHEGLVVECSPDACGAPASIDTPSSTPYRVAVMDAANGKRGLVASSEDAATINRDEGKGFVATAFDDLRPSSGGGREAFHITDLTLANEDRAHPMATLRPFDDLVRPETTCILRTGAFFALEMTTIGGAWATISRRWLRAPTQSRLWRGAWSRPDSRCRRSHRHWCVRMMAADIGAVSPRAQRYAFRLARRQRHVPAADARRSGVRLPGCKSVGLRPQPCRRHRSGITSRTFNAHPPAINLSRPRVPRTPCVDLFVFWNDGPDAIGTVSGGESISGGLFGWGDEDNNIAAGGDAMVDLVRWAHSNWP